jgi:hypothetical protein
VGSYGEGRATVVATGATGVSVHDTGGVEIREPTLQGCGASRTEEAGINLFLSDREARADARGVTVTDVEVTGFQTGVAIGSSVPGRGFADVTVRRAALHGNKDAGMLTYGPAFDARRPVHAHRDLTVEKVDAYDNPRPEGPQPAHGQRYRDRRRAAGGGARVQRPRQRRALLPRGSRRPGRHMDVRLHGRADGTRAR